MSKFLAFYQQFWVPKIGDKIKVVRPLNLDLNDITETTQWYWYYKKGDVGIIKSIDEDTTEDKEFIDFYMIDINGSYVGMVREEFEYHNE